MHVDDGGQRYAQRIQKLLNKGKSVQRPAHAVWHGRNIGVLPRYPLRTTGRHAGHALALRRALPYRHLNLHGEYDFSDQPLPAEVPFDMDRITAWQLPAKSSQG